MSFQPAIVPPAFAEKYPKEVQIFAKATSLLDSALPWDTPHEGEMRRIVELALLAHFLELSQAAFQELTFKRPVAAKILTRCSLECVFQIVALSKSEDFDARLAYVSTYQRGKSISDWMEKTVADPDTLKRAQDALAGMDQYRKEQKEHKLHRIPDIADVAEMSSEYTVDYAILSQYVHADLETLLREHVPFGEDRHVTISMVPLRQDVQDVTALLVSQHLAILLAMGKADGAGELGEYLVEVTGELLKVIDSGKRPPPAS